MSIPLRCAACNDVVGSQAAGLHIIHNTPKWHGHCPGKGNHPKSWNKHGPKRFNNLIQKVFHHAPNGTVHWWEEYVGPEKSWLRGAALVKADTRGEPLHWRGRHRLFNANTKQWMWLDIPHTWLYKGDRYVR